MKSGFSLISREIMKTNYQYLFGPVASRRFGQSLGVDLIPHKTCSLDCVFCQLGRTQKKTVTRKEYVPIEAVLAEIGDWLETDGKADYVTLSGSGEPTLHSRFGQVLELIREKSTIPAVLLTNGTMLHLPGVRDAATRADVVKVSLSAWDQASYEWVNRPYTQLQFDQVLEGHKTFRREFKGQLWLEVMLLNGINSMIVNVRKIAALAKEIDPDRIQLNTVVRPPAEDFAAALPIERMKELIHLFEPPAEIILEIKINFTKELQASEDNILAMLQRRPCTMKQIEQTFGMHINEISKYLGNLMQKNCIRTYHKNKDVYYLAVTRENINKVHV